jgi:hypothetical protein
VEVVGVDRRRSGDPSRDGWREPRAVLGHGQAEDSTLGVMREKDEARPVWSEKILFLRGAGL